MTTCADILSELATTEAEQLALYAATVAEVAPLEQFAATLPGWITLDGDPVPNIAELVNRVHNLGAGHAAWRYVEQTRTDRTVITLPAACTAARLRVWLNGAALTPDDAALTAPTTLTLAAPLELGDELTVRTYG